MITIGRLVSFHGVRGEVRVLSDSDFTAERFQPGNKVLINNKEFTIENYRTHKNFHLLTFEGITNINEVEDLKNADLLQDAESVELELAEGEFHFSDIIGLAVETDEGEALGTVTDIFQTGANDVWAVGDGKKEYMIPYIEDVVRTVDIGNGKIIITPIEGLLE
ncbi:ribosome maturation factor RimM [Lacicoccus alkaliphilus]|uniref:Ribosome maturation factor RimM n=1 Tax=Lacicoccus alkaliphilus DSM 16010 TaxID=1123231 RepID=A0A1M7C801_9BACL|nr:ribosome maturation factor RimM [Salinicoccus alkaliphilus]SHL63334.1 16S rRNA processing protein RimM [Salinicoccus alkaliphilus DSM 16010]